MTEVLATLQLLATEAWDYSAAWLAYIGGCLLALVIFWRWTTAIRWLWCRDLIRALVAALLLLPIPTAVDALWWCPAWIAVLMAAINGQLETVTEVLNQLYLAFGVAVLITLVNQIPRWIRAARRSAA